MRISHAKLRGGNFGRYEFNFCFAYTRKVREKARGESDDAVWRVQTDRHMPRVSFICTCTQGNVGLCVQSVASPPSRPWCAACWSFTAFALD